METQPATQERKPYEMPAVIYEAELEIRAGTTPPPPFPPLLP